MRKINKIMASILILLCLCAVSTSENTSDVSASSELDEVSLEENPIDSIPSEDVQTEYKDNYDFIPSKVLEDNSQVTENLTNVVAEENPKMIMYNY